MKVNFKSLLLVGALTVSTSACQPEKSNDGESDPGANPGHPTEPYAYEMNETDTALPQCSTGVQRPENFHQMCLMLMDQELNNQCAWDLRWKKFYSECHPKGYRAYESVQCTISIVKKEAQIQMMEALNPEDILDQAKTCVGETMGGIISAGLSFDIRLHEKHQFRVGMSFQRQSESETARISRPNATSATIWYFQKSNNLTPENVVVDVKGGSISQLTYGPTYDDQNQYHVHCHKVAYCKSENK